MKTLESSGAIYAQPYVQDPINYYMNGAEVLRYDGRWHQCFIPNCTWAEKCLYRFLSDHFQRYHGFTDMFHRQVVIRRATLIDPELGEQALKAWPTMKPVFPPFDQQGLPLPKPLYVRVPISPTPPMTNVDAAKKELVAKWQCYVCHALLGDEAAAEAHFSACHRTLKERFQPDRVARIWCQKATGQVVSLAPKDTQAATFQGIAPELRGLIFDHLFTLPDTPLEWPDPCARLTYYVVDKNTSVFSALSVNKDCRALGLAALRRNNFFILVKIHGWGVEEMDMFLSRYLADIEPSIPDDIATLIDNTAAEVHIVLSQPAPWLHKVTTSTLVVYSAHVLTSMISHLYQLHECVHAVNVDLLPIASQPQHRTAKSDVVRAFGWLRGLFNLRIHDFGPLDGPVRIMRVPGTALTVSNDIYPAIGVLDRILEDIIAFRAAGRNLLAMKTSEMPRELVLYVIHDWLHPGIEWNTFQDARCQFNLTQAQTVNTGMWQAIQARKPDRINIKTLQDHILGCVTWASDFVGLSRQHRAHAYLAKAISFSFLAHVLVRAYTVPFPGPADSAQAIKPPFPHLAVGFTGYAPNRYQPPPGLHDSAIETIRNGLPNEAQISTPHMAFASAAKYFYLAELLLASPSHQDRAAQMAAEISAQGHVVFSDDEFRLWRSPSFQVGGSREQWCGDHLEWRDWQKTFVNLDAARTRVHGWRNRIVEEQGGLHGVGMGFGIDLSVVKKVCAEC